MVKQEKKSQYDLSLALEKYSGVNCGKLDRSNFNQSRGGGKRKTHVETIFQEIFCSDFIMRPKVICEV